MDFYISTYIKYKEHIYFQRKYINAFVFLFNFSLYFRLCLHIKPNINNNLLLISWKKINYQNRKKSFSLDICTGSIFQTSLKNLLTAFGNWYNHRKKPTNTMDKLTRLFDRSSSNSDRSVQFLNVLNNDTEWNNGFQVCIQRPFNLN